MVKRIFSFILLVYMACVGLFSPLTQQAGAQSSGSSSSGSEYISGTISDKATSKPLFGALLTLYDSKGNATTQKSNSAGGFAFIKPRGSYSLYGSILGYQSNVCFFTVSNDPTEVTFLLGKLGVSSSSCTSKTISATPTPIIGDGSGGPDQTGTQTTPPVPTSGSTSTTSPGGAITTKSNCVVTIIGNPTSVPSLPPECNLASGSNQTNTGGSGGDTSGTPTSCGAAPDVSFTSPEQYENAIKTKFGITFQGFTLDQIQMVWEEFHKIVCTGFLNDIRGTTVGRWENNYSQQFSCPQDGGVNVYFGEHHGDFVRGLITHELTHVWQNCSPRGEQNLLEVPAVYNAEGGLTVYSQTGCNFNVDLIKEDHADTIALYLNPDVAEMTCPGLPNPFSGGRHPAHFALAKRGLGR